LQDGGCVVGVGDCVGDCVGDGILFLGGCGCAAAAVGVAIEGGVGDGADGVLSLPVDVAGVRDGGVDSFVGLRGGGCVLGVDVGAGGVDGVLNLRGGGTVGAGVGYWGWWGGGCVGTGGWWRGTLLCGFC